MFSLIIPTYNRAKILSRSLSHLLTLPGIERCQVIVVDDGSTDETPRLLETFKRSASVPLTVLTLSNGGPARARNHGVTAADNDRILFVDDDVFPRDGMLQHHADKLDDGFAGSQGMLLWHQEIEQTPLIRYIDSRGSQFAFDRIDTPDCLSFAYIYTGNFATYRSAVLDAGGFDETFYNPQLGFSAFEDTILGYRLQQNGARLAFNPRAVADHLHAMTEQGYLQREYKVGYSIGRLNRCYPEIAELLGLHRKDRLAEPQLQVLERLNRMPLLRRALGYAGSMRLQHREAFFRGFLRFQRELSERPV